ncbi:oligosaccharide flippase family protein [Cytobacillus oceanisediminis]|uniref:lipopolysaccharide biosynthesis protein n=1 Tax=Cytobacillus oceanisediminis TaxID=665099 RepID=UPI001D153A1C|nr:oligosaccharide flippase family protein [Cytobacillus oceanisediminis]MCC3648466.1 oligosaccharide flippase family protein [Cytobacillus oceanisediminis]
MNNYKKLINNSLIFAVGNFGSKLIVYFLVPLYTYYLTPVEFGTVDFFITTISFLMPILSFSIADSVLRFVMDKNYDKKVVLINSILIIMLGFSVLLVSLPILTNTIFFKDYLLYFYLLIALKLLNNVFNEYNKGKGLVKLYAVGGILNAFILLISNILLLVIFDKGISGYLNSLIIANMCSSLLAFIGGKIYQDIDIKKVNKRTMKEMLLYSIPLVPNALMWWTMNLSDRYIITFFLGLGANGLYAVANKIPSILNIITSIFFQAWQMSAIEEAESKNKSSFFSNVFNVFWLVMLVSTSFLLTHLKFVIEILVSDDYYSAWKYVPFLLLGVVFSSFSGFLGSNYIAAKKTSGIFKTSVIGAIINIILNITLIPIIGINGAAIGTMISFFIIWLLRIIDTKQFVNIKLNIIKFTLTMIVICLQIGVLYLNLPFEYIVQLSFWTLVILINFKEIKVISLKLIGVLRKKFK